MDESCLLLMEKCAGCGLPAENGKKLRRCTRCLQVAYHDTTCQRLHYPVHKLKCAALAKTTESWYEVKDINNGCGKSVLASRTIERGERLTPKGPSSRFQPLVRPVLLSTSRSSHCIYCLKSVEDSFGSVEQVSNHHKYVVRRCGQCAEVKEVSNETQSVLKLLSLAEAHQHASGIEIFPTALLVYRILLQVQDGGLNWESISTMASHDDIPADTAIEHRLAVEFTVSQLLHQTTGQYPTPSQLARIKPTLTRIRFNAFTITDTSGEAVGFGLYESPAHRFNHSCEPNSRQSFVDGVTLEIRSLRRIQKGEEVTLSYIDANSCLEHRRQYLQKNYNFTCDCSLCRKES